MSAMSFNSMTSSCYPYTANVSGVYPYTSGGAVYPSSVASVTSGGTWWGTGGTGGTGWTQVFPSQTAVWSEPKKDKDPIEKLMEFMTKDKEERMARQREEREEERRQAKIRDQKMEEMMRKMGEAQGNNTRVAGTEYIKQQDLNKDEDFKDPVKFESWEQLRKGNKGEDVMDTVSGNSSSIDDILAYKMLFDTEKKSEEEKREKERTRMEIERLTMLLEQERDRNAKYKAMDREQEREADQRRFEMAMRAQDGERQTKLESERMVFDRFRMELQARQASEILVHKQKMRSTIISGIVTFVTAVMVLGSLAFGVIATKEYDIKMLKLNKGVETSQSK